MCVKKSKATHLIADTCITQDVPYGPGGSSTGGAFSAVETE
jgi:hypothetical protein